MVSCLMMSCLLVFKLRFHQNKLYLKFVRVLNITHLSFSQLFYFLFLVHVCFYFHSLCWTYFEAHFGSSSQTHSAEQPGPTSSLEQACMPSLFPTLSQRHQFAQSLSVATLLQTSHQAPLLHHISSLLHPHAKKINTIAMHNLCA